MPRLSKGARPVAKDDVLEVIHHTIPENAAAAGAAPIPSVPEQANRASTEAMPGDRMQADQAQATQMQAAEAPTATYREGGMTWRRMLRSVAITEVAGLAVLLVAGMLYGIDLFVPALIAGVLFAGAIAWLPRMSKAGTVYSLVICSLTLLLLGGFGLNGFRYTRSWFEMTFATLSVIVPIAGIVAAIAVLRHRDGTDAAKTPSRVVAAVAGAIVLVSIVGSVTASDATRLPGDVSLTAANSQFSQKALTAKAGNVAIHFRNDDPFAHNVTIKDHGGSPDANGRMSIRHVFNLSAGTYSYFCSIHPDMKGTLTVT